VQVETISLKSRRKGPRATAEVDGFQRPLSGVHQGLQMRVEGAKNSLVSAIRKDIVIAVLRHSVEKCDLGRFLLQAG
jgi:hypothetical protein